jgi:hypothetical protein
MSFLIAQINLIVANAQHMHRATMANKGIGDTTEQPKKRLNVELVGNSRCNTHFLPRAQLKSFISMTITRAMGI